MAREASENCAELRAEELRAEELRAELRGAPARAPASIAMFEIDIRASLLQCQARPLMKRFEAKRKDKRLENDAPEQVLSHNITLDSQR